MAQLSVPVPEGLDLDAWIVPPPKDPLVEAATSNGVDDEDRPTKKSKGKGKAKARNGSGVKTKGKKGESSRRDGFTPPVEQVPETPEERAERERVRLYSSLLQNQCEPHFEFSTLSFLATSPAVGSSARRPILHQRQRSIDPRRRRGLNTSGPPRRSPTDDSFRRYAFSSD